MVWKVPTLVVIGGHLMEAQLYTEWDDNHVCIINQ